MGPRWSIHPATTIGLLVVAAALLLSSTAQAATVSQKNYKIFTTYYKAELAYSNSKMQANVNAAQTKLASTASSISALSSSNVNAATALVDELECQYDVAGAIGLFKADLTSLQALSKLKLPKAQHKDVMAELAYIKRVLSINTASDMAHWQAAGFAPSKEPANTKQFGGFFGVGLRSPSVSISGNIKAFEKLANKASNKSTAVFNTLSTDWATWAAQFGIQAG